ncbi:Helix-turn-helix [uncultured Ruminococcus sp.]|nr:Helix-turn-helix [uncultured Ruminococcus sp.]
MDFKKLLDDYMKQLDCTAKDLAENSGLSAATISRYRSGERIPEDGSENFDRLINGIVSIAENKKIPNITVQSVSEAFSPYVRNNVDIAHLQKNFHTLLTVVPINISDLARFLNYDPSYISRIRNGQRQPANPTEFARKISIFVTKHFQTVEQKAVISSLINCPMEELSNYTDFQDRMTNWLLAGSGAVKDSMTVFLEKLDEFNLNEYIHSIHFNELKIPSVPFQIPISRTYWGIKEMMESELDFLKATVLSKSTAPVIMYSDMPMKEMAKDPEFPKKWMFGMAMMLKKGLHLYQIHNLDRSFDEMMLGLESWIPMYMTGLISPYYLKNVQNNTFLHLLKVSGSAALSGEAITGCHENGKYYLTKSKREVAYYQRRADELLKNADSLMDIYRSEREAELNTFLISDIRKSGKRRGIRSTLPLYTISEELLERILIRHDIDGRQKQRIRKHVKMQKERIISILASETLEDEVPALTPEEFSKNPPVLDLSGIFCETNLPYSEAEYMMHMSDTKAFARKNPNYILRISTTHAFHNLQILVHEGQWAMISKSKAPAIHFIIHHPKLRNAIENFIPPIVE